MKKHKIVVAQMIPSAQTEYMEVGDWARKRKVKDVLVIGSLFLENKGNYGVSILFSEQLNAEYAKKQLASSANLPEFSGKDVLSVWVPLNNIEEMFYFGFESLGEFAEDVVKMLIDESGFSNEVEQAVKKMKANKSISKNN